MRLSKIYKQIVIAAAVLAVAGVLWAKRDDSDGNGPKSVHETNAKADSPTAGSTGLITPAITFHGGPVMQTPNVYLIWYGNWNQSNNSDTPAGQALLSTFVTNLNGSQWFAINTTYNGPSGAVFLAGSIADNYSQGTKLSDADVQSVVSNAIAGGKLPKDSNGVYFVLTSSDVSERSGFCNRYCGWHTYGTIAGTAIKYAFVGNAQRCLTSCAAQTISPNNNAGVDGMISVVAHELSEATTDPLLNAWYDSRGAENADKCAWTFGQPSSSGGPLTLLPSGAYYNVTLNGTHYLIQRNLQANTNKCYVGLNGLQ